MIFLNKFLSTHQQSIIFANMLPKHDLVNLYKYASFETAKKIIKLKKFQWSSPLMFNDPFDHQTGFYFDYKADELVNVMSKMITSIVYAETEFNPFKNTNLAKVVQMLWKNRHNIPQSEMFIEIINNCNQLAQELPHHQDSLNKNIISFMTNARVICLSESGSNVVMWSHYAQDHHGIVFKLRRLEEWDHQFLVARKVTYSNEPLPYLKMHEWLENLLGIADHDPTPLIWDLAYRKHSDWSYEREWRVHMPLLEQNIGDDVSLFDEPSELFEAIYLGCRMNKNDAHEIISLLDDHLPDTEIYQAYKIPNKMHLEFE